MTTTPTRHPPETTECSLCWCSVPNADITQGHNFGAGPFFACKNCVPPKSAEEAAKAIKMFFETIEVKPHE